MPDNALESDYSPLRGVIVWPDGYIRLTLGRFRSIPLVHLISGLDADLSQPVPNSVGASVSVIAGFTEWSSKTLPALSLGWDWQLDSSDQPLRYVRVGEARSNVMLIDDRRHDRGWRSTAALLALLIDELNWQSTVLDYVRSRYQ